MFKHCYQLCSDSFWWRYILLLINVELIWQKELMISYESCCSWVLSLSVRSLVQLFWCWLHLSHGYDIPARFFRGTTNLDSRDPLKLWLERFATCRPLDLAALVRYARQNRLVLRGNPNSARPPPEPELYLRCSFTVSQESPRRVFFGANH